MRFTETALKGAYIIELEQKSDERGYFLRTFCKKEFNQIGVNIDVAQCNMSFSKLKRTMRGMHFQKVPYTESKVIKCVNGSIYDVIVDFRQDSPTFLKWISVELTQDNFKMLYVPEGFAHGFQTLEDNALVAYINGNYYTPQAESGLRWNDPFLSIDWPFKEKVIISEKDANWSLLG